MKNVVNTVTVPGYPVPFDNIVLSSQQTKNGWIIEARLSQNVTSSDEVKGLNYLQNYANSIRKEHPLWSIYIAIDRNRYRLEITQTKNVIELFNDVQKKARWGS